MYTVLECGRSTYELCCRDGSAYSIIDAGRSAKIDLHQGGGKKGQGRSLVIVIAADVDRV